MHEAGETKKLKIAHVLGEKNGNNMQGQKQIAQFYERRFLREYKIAFDAWIKTDPINNSNAPPGPTTCLGIRAPR